MSVTSEGVGYSLEDPGDNGEGTVTVVAQFSSMYCTQHRVKIGLIKAALYQAIAFYIEVHKY